MLGAPTTGLSTALAAAALLFVAEVLDRLKLDRHDPEGEASRERFWGQAFPQVGDRFFARPCEIAFSLVVLISGIKILYHLAPADVAPGTALAATLLALLLGRQAWRLDSSAIGWAMALPLFLAVGMWVASLPSSWRPHGFLFVLVVAHALHFLWRQRAPAGLREPWRRLTYWASWAMVGLAFPAYALIGNKLAMFTWITASILLTHLFLMRASLEDRTNLVDSAEESIPGIQSSLRPHPVLLHVALAGALVLLDLRQGLPGLLRDHLAQTWFVGLFVVLFCFALFLETRREPWLSYSRCTQLWLAGLAVIYGVSSLFFGIPIFEASSVRMYWVMPLIAWPLLVLANRHWQSGILLGLRAFVALALEMGLFPRDLVGGSLLGLWLFLAWEVIVQRMEGDFGERFRATPFARKEIGGRPLSVTVLLQAVTVFCIHLFLSLMAETGAPPRHLWLLGLIPIFFLLAQMTGERALRSVGLAIFPWTLSFLAVDLRSAVAGLELTPLHLISGAFVASLLVFQAVSYRAGTRLQIDLERHCTALGVGVMVLLGVNFSLAHDLATQARFRFLFSFALLALVTGYFRFFVRKVENLHRAAYRVAATLTFWSLGFALIPSPQTFLYLILLPALFFAVRQEMKHAAAAIDDQIAAGILYTIAAVLYFEQQPMRLVFFPGQPFDAASYLWNAPVLLAVGIGYLRLNHRSTWRGLAFLGTLFAGAGTVLTLSLVTGPLPLARKVEEAFGLPVEILWTLLVVHGLTAMITVSPTGWALERFAGLSEEEAKGFRKQIWWVGVAVLQGVLFAALLLAKGQTLAFFVALAALPIWLWRQRGVTVSIVLVEAALLFFPVGLVFPAFSMDLICIFLTALLALCVALRRSYRLDLAPPNETYVLCVSIFVASLVFRGLFHPSSLVFLALLTATWILLPGRPGRVTTSQGALLWPPAALLILLCLAGGYDPSLWPWWALFSIAPPLIASTYLRGRKGVPEALGRISWMSLAITVAAFFFAYPQHVEGWRSVLILLSALGCQLAVHLYHTVRRLSVSSAALTELHVWLMLALVRWKLEVLEILDLGTPIDGYVLLGAAFLAAGVREVVRRRAESAAQSSSESFSRFFYLSSILYGFVGWAWTMWIQFMGDAPFGGHGEAGSLLMAGLYWWFAATRQRTQLIPAFVFANIAGMLYCIRGGYHHPQFYILPAMATVLVLAQMLKDKIEPRQLQYLRLGCALGLLGTTTFYNVVDFGQSLLYPLTAALLSALLVVVGVALRVRIFLFLGFSSFLVNTLAVLVHVIRAQPESQEKLLLGAIFLLVGVFFTGSFLLLQWRRREILQRYEILRDELAEWN